MGGLFRFALVLFPVAMILIFLLLVRLEKHDLEFAQENAKFEQEWKAFEHAYFPKMDREEEKLAEKRRKEEKEMRRKIRQLSEKQARFLGDLEREMKRVSKELEGEEKKTDAPKKVTKEIQEGVK